MKSSYQREFAFNFLEVLFMLDLVGYDAFCRALDLTLLKY